MSKTPVRMQITDHALLRYIERRYGVPLEALRAEMQEKAMVAATAAMRIGGGRYRIKFDGVTFRCADNYVVTVVGKAHVREPADD